MKYKYIIISCSVLLFVIVGSCIFNFYDNKTTSSTKKMEAKVLSNENNLLTLQDKKNTIYTFDEDGIDVKVGDNVLIEYTCINSKKDVKDCSITNYETINAIKEVDGIPSEWQDDGIFSDYYLLAYNKLKSLTLDEKIGQLFLVRYPETNQVEDLKQYKFAGFVFFGKDFTDKSEIDVQNMINGLQKDSNIPLLTAVDEEGGIVTRISTNPKLVSEKFKSSRDLYNAGGFEAIKEDTINKSKILKNLGLNLNLAPVVDVSTNQGDYMYSRSLGQDTKTTSTYAETVISASKNTGVSYTLKHFPGYGNNVDTHTQVAKDTRSKEDILNNDIPPFEAGIKALAEAILVSHNIVNSIDPDNPASLSASIHNLLRNELNFTGIIITDDLAMEATSNIDNAAVKAILAGNDLIITTDYKRDIEKVKTALSNNTLTEDIIDKIAFRVIAWKYYKGLMFENQK